MIFNNLTGGLTQIPELSIFYRILMNRASDWKVSSQAKFLSTYVHYFTNSRRVKETYKMRKTQLNITE